MVTIIFIAHATTYDNETHCASGFNDVELSPLGIQQSKEMGERYENDHFDVVFCSDLQRSYKTAEIAFGDKYKIIKDARLRECDYGDYTGYGSEEIERERPLRITEPFPNGESYAQTTARMKSFIQDLLRDYDGKKVMIIGHRATQYGLMNVIDGVPLEEITTEKFIWQPGWKYELDTLKNT